VRRERVHAPTEPLSAARSDLAAGRHAAPTCDGGDREKL
jgi:hypothetical protein